MTNTDQTHPFAKRKMDQLSRRSFTKGMLTAGMALATAPIVFPNVVKASTGTSLSASSSLQSMITEQFLKFNGQSFSGHPTLASAIQNDAFHKLLGQRLLDFNPAAPRGAS